MKVLYIYDKMPGLYQNYLRTLLDEIKKKVQMKVLVYHKTNEADIVINSVGLSNKIQRVLFKLKLSKDNSTDIKAMKSFPVIHIQHSYLKNKIYPFFTRVDGPKIVITLRGGDTYLKPWLSKQWRDFYNNKSSFIAAFVVMSEHQKKYLMRWGVASSKIHVIPISFGKKSLAKPKYPSSDKIRLVSAFRMTWEKNIEGCIKFAALLKEKNIPFSYDLYGDGRDLGQLYLLVDKYELSKEVTIHGSVANPILKERLSSYDFFVQLSISEALPTSVLEAQSLGIPCIVSNSGGLPEAVINLKTAIVQEYDAIESLVEQTVLLWKDKKRYFSYSEAAIKNCNTNFSTEIEANKLLELYTSLH
ncbi:amylovoran biosynthesis glycosyl transferase AmsK [unidentified eubacterium SCB49]|nr:amylovoran biosynthesis glycosyl transferase AmsK [unidentified eubacterium SCB49]